jgi:O-antigen ligase
MSIWRRDIIGIIEFVVIVAALTALIEGKKIFASIGKYFNLRSIIWIFSGYLVIQLLFPQFIENSIDLTVETLERINLIESSRHTENDARMSLAGKKSIIKAFEQNPWIGTGYHDAWMTGDGGRNEWEGADYVFLACLAMYGLIGLFLFVPFYVFVFGRIATFIKISKNNYTKVKNRQDLVLPLVFGVASSSEFIKNLIEYPNWFYPVGAVPTHEKYFIYFGVLLGSIVCLLKNLKKKDHVRTY